MKATATRYNVYIVRDKDDKAVSLIGINLTWDNADKRSDTEIYRINMAEYWPYSEKVGSEKDLKYAADVKEPHDN